MSAARQLGVWVVAMLAATASLVGVLRWEREHAGARWGVVPPGDASRGERLFQEKGCAQCHAVGGAGGSIGPDLGSGGAAETWPDAMVTAMWNHAPSMWERMEAGEIDYPTMSREEMADAFAFLYTAQRAGEPGDPDRGRALFDEKGCSGCHAAADAGRDGAPDLSALRSAASPIAWARALWNHPRARAAAEAAPGAGADDAGSATDGAPRFDGSEMSDLFAFVRDDRAPPPVPPALLAADADRGWTVFREKSCAACHSVRDEGGRVGPALGPGRALPPNVVRLAGSLWNHSGAMADSMKRMGLERPRLDDQEMADVVAFLYSFRYTEPGGSAKVGEVLFSGRGCGRCHGALGDGTPLGPRLRGRGRNFTSVGLAVALWRHGPGMVRRAQELGVGWPLLARSDVGDLLAFLNMSPDPRR